MKTLAICGLEKEYVTRLAEAFRRMCGKDTEVLLFTDSEAIGEYLGSRKIDICLSLEDFKIQELSNVGSLIYLSEEENVPGKVFRYMSCDRIYGDALALCAEKSGNSGHIFNSGEKELIGIYTPIKRSFQTSFALTLGQVLSRTKKVLYLNFESFSGFDNMSGKLGGSDLMDLLYFSECDDANFAYRVDSLKERLGELDYISPTKAFVKFSLVTAEQWEKLLNSIIEKTDYETVILDLSENVSGLLDILKKCSVVYTITDSDKVATAKIGQYESILRESGYQDILSRTETIKIPVLREIPHNYELLPHTELADFVKKLIRYDLGGEGNE